MIRRVISICTLLLLSQNAFGSDLFSDWPDPTRVAPARDAQWQRDNFGEQTSIAGLFEAAVAISVLHASREKFVIARDASPLYWAMALVAKTIGERGWARRLHHINLSRRLLATETSDRVRRYLGQFDVNERRLGQRTPAFEFYDTGMYGSIVNGVHSGAHLRGLFPGLEHRLHVTLLFAAPEPTSAGHPIDPTAGSMPMFFHPLEARSDLDQPLEPAGRANVIRLMAQTLPVFHQQAESFADTPRGLVPQASLEPQGEDRVDAARAHSLLGHMAYVAASPAGRKHIGECVALWKRLAKNFDHLDSRTLGISDRHLRRAVWETITAERNTRAARRR